MENWSVLFSEMTPDAAWEGEFNAWYDEEHIPVRMAAPGFAGAQRYRRDERNYLAIYDLADPSALNTPKYQAIKGQPSPLTRRMLDSVSGFTRYIGRPISGESKPPLIEAHNLRAHRLCGVFQCAGRASGRVR
jgi:hypothetical protein